MQTDTVIQTANSWPKLFYQVTIILFATPFIPIPANSEPTAITGTVAHVRDGDTIEVDRIHIRLNGVSAPELNEPLRNVNVRA